MSDVIIRAENLGKSYIIGHEKREQYTALRDVMVNKLKQVTGKTRQIFKGGQLIAGNELEEFWALKDLNFEIKQGDRVGIIGRNGAGKSTLLKVLSRITEPSTGKVQIKGRVASLLEVGTGFHPELTGRENIFLNGAILGMSRAEIRKKFDEIVDFSGVEKFLDTPVKRYSSGMYVRLAFSVAAHLEPEILIVDEVLAVGDMEFQKKCMGKMEAVSEKEGRTVLFVSHNMNAIKYLCTRGIHLEKGMVLSDTTSSEAVTQYLNFANNIQNLNSEIQFTPDTNKRAQVISLRLLNSESGKSDVFSVDQSVFVEIIYDINILRSGIAVGLDVYNEDEVLFRTFDTDTKPQFLEARPVGRYKTILEIPPMFKDGMYSIKVYISLLRFENLDLVEQTLKFKVSEDDIDTSFKSFASTRPGIVKTNLSWDITTII
jgi:ABC-type polysaccharide/polyol phosphate transport system, ATPase component